MYDLEIIFTTGTSPSITVTDNESYTSPLVDVKGDLVVTAPDGTTAFSGEIDHDISLSVGFPSPLLDGAIMPGCYSFTYTPQDGPNRLATQTTKIDFDYTPTVGEISFDVQCLLSRLTANDTTGYPSGATNIVRSLQLVPPVGSNITADAAVDANTVFRSPIVTQTWTATLSSAFRVDLTGYSVIDSFDISSEQLVQCDIDVCGLLDCVNKLRNQYEKALDKNPSKACDLEKELNMVVSAMVLMRSAAECGNNTLAQSLYNDIKDIISCDCGCDGDTEGPVEVIPLNTIQGPAGPAGPAGAQGPAGDAATVSITQIPSTTTGLAITNPSDGVYEVSYSLFVEGLVFVDNKYGDDTTGARERRDLPFATLAAAEAVAENGDKIVVYGESVIADSLGGSVGLGVNKITYQFASQCVLTTATTGYSIDLTNIRDIDISGPVTIDCNGSELAVVGTGYTVDMKVDSIANCTTAFTCTGTSSGRVNLKASSVESDRLTSADGSVDFYLDIAEYSPSGATSSTFYSTGSYSGLIDARIPKAETGASTTSTFVDFGVGGTSVGKLKFSGYLSDVRTTSTIPAVLVASGDVEFDGDINSVSGPCMGTYFNGSSGELRYKGSARSAASEAVQVSGSGKSLTISGKISTVSAREAVKVSTIGNVVKLRDVDIVCPSSNGRAVMIDNTSTVMLQGAKLISGGDYSVDTSLLTAPIIVPTSTGANKPFADAINVVTQDAPITIDSNIIE